MPSQANPLVWALLALFGALAIGSAVRVFSLRNSPEDIAKKRTSSLVVWWLLAVVFSAALLLGRPGLAVLCCVATLLAVREFHAIYAKRSFDSPVLAITLCILAVLHYTVLTLTAAWPMWALPMVSLVLLSTIEICLGRTEDYLRATAGYFWAFVLMVFGLSHVVVLTSLDSPIASLHQYSVGWCIYLVILTESNDIAQALVGRQIGRRRITPISPHKTWEGLAGGVVITIILAVLLAPILTTLTRDRPFGLAIALSAMSGLIISLSGFIGDLNISALKREAGVKDSSHLLPGMGGMIDRIDSLTIAAPVFYYFVTSFVQA